ncbi:hypothetical protein [Deinococcus sp.]
MSHWIHDLIGLLSHALQGWVHAVLRAGLPLYIAWRLVNPDND